MFCTKCGTQINDNAAICPNCGCPTGAQPTAQYQPQPVQQYQQPAQQYQQAQYQEPSPQQPMTVEQASQKVEKNGLAIAAVIFAIIVPIVGIICGIIGAVKYQDKKYKIQCIIAIPVAIVVWIISAVILSGAL